MTLTAALAIYFIIWWLTLFAVLPFGVRTQAEAGSVVPGTPESAPARFALGRTALITTGVSLVAFAAFYLITQTGWITLDDIPFMRGPAHY